VPRLCLQSDSRRSSTFNVHLSPRDGCKSLCLTTRLPRAQGPATPRRINKELLCYGQTGRCQRTRRSRPSYIVAIAASTVCCPSRTRDSAWERKCLIQAVAIVSAKGHVEFLSFSAWRMVAMSIRAPSYASAPARMSRAKRLCQCTYHVQMCFCGRGAGAKRSPRRALLGGLARPKLRRKQSAAGHPGLSTARNMRQTTMPSRSSPVSANCFTWLDPKSSYTDVEIFSHRGSPGTRLLPVQLSLD
jgi:hypothetical protein